MAAVDSESPIGGHDGGLGDAGGEAVVTDQAHVHGPLGLALARNGDLISRQGDAISPDPKQPSEVADFTAAGQFVAQFSVDATARSAFGLPLRPLEDGFIFATVDDTTAVLEIWVVKGRGWVPHRRI